MKNFDIFGVHEKIRVLGVHEKPIQFADLRGGGGVFEGGIDTPMYSMD